MTIASEKLAAANKAEDDAVAKVEALKKQSYEEDLKMATEKLDPRAELAKMESEKRKTAHWVGRVRNRRRVSEFLCKRS